MPLVILWHKLQQIELLLFASVTVNAIIESWLICLLTVSLKVGNFVTSFWHLDCRRIFFYHDASIYAVISIELNREKRTQVSNTYKSASLQSV